MLGRMQLMMLGGNSRWQKSCIRVSSTVRIQCSGMHFELIMHHYWLVPLWQFHTSVAIHAYFNIIFCLCTSAFSMCIQISVCTYRIQCRWDHDYCVQLWENKLSGFKFIRWYKKCTLLTQGHHQDLTSLFVGLRYQSTSGWLMLFPNL